MKKAVFLAVVFMLLASTVVFAGNGKGDGWGEPAPNSGDGIPDGPGR